MINNTAEYLMKTKNLNLNNEIVLVTGAAGFIGAALTEYLINRYENIKIIGADDLNDYYDVSLKQYRLGKIQDAVRKQLDAEWIFEKGNIANESFINSIFDKYHPRVVVNLAAQAGVRYSITNPYAYIESNIVGFFRILEACRHASVNKENEIKHFIYASSSSVYGNNNNIPYTIDAQVDKPVSLYAATKKSDELIAYSYAKLYNIPMTGLRFFTVYGPAGRPDMAYFKFTNMLRDNRKIGIYNYGKSQRDYTYIDDVVECIYRVMQSPPEKSIGMDGLPVAPYALYNIGNNHPEKLLDFVRILAVELIDAGVLPQTFTVDEYCDLLPMQAGDVEITYADTSSLERDFGFKPQTTLNVGLREFAKWYKKYYITNS